MEKTKIINYLVSVTDTRCPKSEPILFSALEILIPWHKGRMPFLNKQTFLYVLQHNPQRAYRKPPLSMS